MSEKILGIDPANVRTAYVIVDRDFNLYDSGRIPNKDFLQLMNEADYDVVACEVIINMGVSNKTLYATSEFIGKIDLTSKLLGKPFHRVKRTQTKKHFDVRSKVNGIKQPSADSQILTYLSHRFAKEPKVNFGKGSKEKPDYFYGFVADMWQAMGVAVYFIDTTKERQYKLDL